MIIIDQLPVPSGGDNDGDLEDLSPWNNNKDDEELRREGSRQHQLSRQL